ncbi:MAG: cytochrome P450 [Blastocatellia bacterium AA13]|nr:MAG: cytochrome P450 [Blastocatellia bacterium AA13]
MTVAAYPPGPKRKLPGGFLLSVAGDPLSFLMEQAREYGDLVYFKLGREQVYFINHPDYIRDVLVTHSRNFTKSRGLEMAKRFLGEGLLTSEGEFHRRQRRLVQPAFHRQRINAYATVMAEYARRMSERWVDGAAVDISKEMMRLTLAIVGKTLFNADVESEAAEVGQALTAILHLFSRMFLPFSALLQKLPLPANIRFKKSADRLDAIVYRMIEEHRASGEDRGDLLSMLLMAQDEEEGGARMTDKQVRDEAMTLFIAGHETTANALTWTWYLLSRNPQAEAEFHREIDEVLGGRLPSAEDVQRLPYTEMVLSESMRLYPPAWALGRRAIDEYELGGYKVPPRSIIFMSPYVMHHHERYYPDPFKFDPMRWTAEAREARPRFSYFPFGGGPRVCIGESFAWMEGILVLATIARDWRMRIASGHKVEPQPIVTLRPKYGMRMVLEKRV